MTTAGPKYLGSPTATGFRLRISTCWPGTKLWVGLSHGIGRERETSAHTEISLSIREITQSSRITSMSPKEETPARPLTQGVRKGLPIKISNGVSITYPHCKYFVVEDGVILISANTAGNTSGHFLLVSIQAFVILSLIVR